LGEVTRGVVNGGLRCAGGRVGAGPDLQVSMAHLEYFTFALNSSR
jgi:hypothetical protein